jgi:tetratricopeptide (TPR) repeat protein
MDTGMFKLPSRGFLDRPVVRRLLLGTVVFALLLGAFIGWRSTSQSAAPAVLSQTYAQALEMAHNGKPGAARVLYQQLARGDLSDIRRASLLAELAFYPSPQALKLLNNALDHESVLVRLAAIETTSQMLPNAQRSIVLGPLLDDPEPSIKLAVTMALLDLAPDDLGLYYVALQQSVEAMLKTLALQPPDAVTQLQLARLQAHNGDGVKALATLQAARAREPENLDLALAWIDLMDKQGKADDARQLLGQLLSRHPQSARLQYALGQWLLAHAQAEYALLALAKAVELEPDNGHYRYQLAAALHDLQQVEAAQRQLNEILQRQPANRQARVLLIRYWQETGQLQNVQVLLAELEQQNPDDPALQQGL